MPSLFEIALYAQRVLFIMRCMATSAAFSYALLRIWNENADRHPAVRAVLTAALYGTLTKLAQDAMYYNMPAPVLRGWAVAYIILTFVTAVMVVEWIRMSYEAARGHNEQYYAQMLVIHAIIFIIAGRSNLDVQKYSLVMPPCARA